MFYTTTRMGDYETMICLILVQVLLLTGGIAGGKVPAIIVFGDSSVDAGNNNQISTPLKSNFEPYGRDFFGGNATGRFSNGRIAPDFISEAFGIKPYIPAYLDPTYSIKDFATGVCFASAGTGYDNATADVLNVLPLWMEIEYFKDYQMKLRRYLGTSMANMRMNEALYLISIGTNDFLENYYIFSGRSSEFTIEKYKDYLIGIAESFVREIYYLGARKISLGGLPAMGCLPLERTINFLSGSDCNEEYNNVAMDFNGKLIVLRDKLGAELPGIMMVYSDVYNIMLEVIQNPSLHGFENVEEGCCATGMFEMGYLCTKWSPFTCTDANKFVFWDSFHPTEKMNSIMADHALNTSLSVFM
ncbi:GDSL esterase/lipase At2g04570-like [Tasmannia lanceolata]|uniref:GDSL esterase/lipase At2g04570-like n=1 Tax=Tasmannia lanceolata TaxID=3420 RepID=UPI004063D5F5